MSRRDDDGGDNGGIDDGGIGGIGFGISDSGDDDDDDDYYASIFSYLLLSPAWFILLSCPPLVLSLRIHPRALCSLVHI